MYGRVSTCPQKWPARVSKAPAPRARAPASSACRARFTRRRPAASPAWSTISCARSSGVSPVPARVSSSSNRPDCRASAKAWLVSSRLANSLDLRKRWTRAIVRSIVPRSGSPGLPRRSPPRSASSNSGNVSASVPSPLVTSTVRALASSWSSVVAARPRSSASRHASSAASGRLVVPDTSVRMANGCARSPATGSACRSHASASAKGSSSNGPKWRAHPFPSRRGADPSPPNAMRSNAARESKNASP